jgi:signal transduction histidine kinase
MRPQEGVHSSLQAAAREVIDELLPAAKARDVELELVPMDPIDVACAPGALISILSNLIGNAIKYMDEGPQKYVRVSAQDMDTKVRIEVLDTGPGVPADLRERIFDPYARAAASSIPGLGLGLATVRQLVQAHGGAAGVLPGDERGSRFWVELPKAPKPTADGAPGA